MMDFAEYKGIEAINASSLKQGALSMLHMNDAMHGIWKDQTPAMRWGSLAHKAILEPNDFSCLASVYEGVRRGKDWDAFLATHDAEFIVKPDELERLQAMSKAVHANDTAHKLIAECVPEFTLEWNSPDYGKAKGRCDGLSKTAGIIEYKTAANIDERRFASQCVSMGYDLACGWYVEGAMELDMFADTPSFTFIVQQSKAPFDVAVYYAPKQMITLGRKNARKLAIQYRQCEADGIYPGIQKDGPKELVMPEWYGSDDIMASFVEMSADEL
jgi:hypothetical protein